MEAQSEFYQFFPSNGVVRVALCDHCKDLSLTKLIGGGQGQICPGFVLIPAFRIIRSNSDRCHFCHSVAFSIELSGHKPLPGNRIWLRPVNQSNTTAWYTASDALDGFQLFDGDDERLERWQWNSPDDWHDLEETVVGFLRCDLHADDGIRSVVTRSSSHNERRPSVFRKWLSICDTKHKTCQVVSHTAECVANVARKHEPKRILRLSLDQDQPRVQLQNFKDVRGPYAALSHCWGSANLLKTTEVSLPLFEQEVQWTALPKTFQHAIELARRMDLQLIWIDSLCIIQDDAHDWAEESLKMKDVYSGAYITIAAAASSSAAGGCFPYEALSSDCTTLPQGPEDPTLVARLMPFPARICWWRFDQEPLQTRAWALQERLVSRRILHCSNFEYFWMCRKRVKSSLGTGFEGRDSWEFTKENIFVPSKFLSPVDACKQWAQSAMDYSCRQLTLPTDKAVALHGVAETLQPFIPGQYAFGVWEFALCEGILWFYATRSRTGVDEAGETIQFRAFGFNENDLARQKYIPGRAPSWSWLSVDGLVDIMTPNEEDSDHKLDPPSDPESYQESHQGSDQESGPVVPPYPPRIPLYDPKQHSDQDSEHEGTGIQAQISFAKDQGITDSEDLPFSILRATGIIFEIKLLAGLPAARREDNSEPDSSLGWSNMHSWYWQCLDGRDIMGLSSYLSMDDPHFADSKPASAKFYALIVTDESWLLLMDTELPGRYRRIGLLRQWHKLIDMLEDDEKDAKHPAEREGSLWQAHLDQIINSAREETILIC